MKWDPLFNNVSNVYLLKDFGKNFQSFIKKILKFPKSLISKSLISNVDFFQDKKFWASEFIRCILLDLFKI